MRSRVILARFNIFVKSIDFCLYDKLVSFSGAGNEAPLAVVIRNFPGPLSRAVSFLLGVLVFIGIIYYVLPKLTSNSPRMSLMGLNKKFEQVEKSPVKFSDVKGNTEVLTFLWIIDFKLFFYIVDFMWMVLNV